MRYSTPIIFLIFRRPDLTARVFERIRAVQPTKLLIVADGPRTEAESELCQQARAITEQVDWECKVLRDYSDINLGCKRRVSSGLDWAFRNVEEAVILEDDCLPDITFFQFCNELIEYYRFDSRIMTISGSNFQSGIKRSHYSYYYSIYNYWWGWATWKRAWQYYDVNIKIWPKIKQEKWLQDILGNSQLVNQWTSIFDEVFNDRIDTWDYQWRLSCWLQNGLTVVPQVNLVSNIGFSADATHTTESTNLLANIQSSSIDFPLSHPDFVIKNSFADKISDILFNASGRTRRIKVLLRNLLLRALW